MKIAPDAAWDFINLYHALLYYAGQVREILPAEMTYANFVAEPLATKARCRDPIYEPKPLFDDFLEDRGDALTQKQQKMVREWKRFVRGDFVVLRHLKKHTIFLSTTGPMKAYAVLSLTTDLPEMIPNDVLPVYVETVLLPYQGVIVYDGIVLGGNILIGPNMTREMKEDYSAIKKAKQVITTL
jgi:hypothetical protein